MQLTPSDIQAFIEAWELDFGEQITPVTADTEGKRLISFFLDLAEARLDAAGKAALARDTMPR